MKRNYNKKKGDSREYKPGAKVWLEGTNITTDRPIKKLNDKRHGPFVIDKKIGESSYRLKLPTTWKKVYATFNEKYLSPFVPAEFPSQKLPDPPPPIITNEGEEYVVEEVMDSKLSRGRLKYLVKWEGYPSRADWTWEPESSILPDNRAEFHEKHPGAPRRIDMRGMTFQPMPKSFKNDAPEEITWQNGKLTDDIDRGRSTLRGGNVTNKLA